MFPTAEEMFKKLRIFVANIDKNETVHEASLPQILAVNLT